jgi:hypothetical protein
MQIICSARASRVLVAACATTAALCVAATQGSATAASKASVSNVTVRVEGPTETLVPPTNVTLTNTAVSKDGKAADSCSGLSALAALQDATNGHWNGTWSKSYRSYFITAIGPLHYSSTASYYWAFWLDNKPASVGACSTDPANGSSVLFFAQYDGKNKKLTAPSVLGVTGPSAALVGKPFTLTVSSYANANGKQRPARGASVTADGKSLTTSSTGTVKLALTRAGNATIDVSAPNSIRTEMKVCIHAPGKTCKAA